MEPDTQGLSVALMRRIVHLVRREFPSLCVEDCEDAVSDALVYELVQYADDQWRARRLTRKSLCNAYDLLRYYHRRPTCDIDELCEVLPSQTAHTERQALARMQIQDAMDALQPRGQRRLLEHVLNPNAPAWGKANVSKIRRRLRQQEGQGSGRSDGNGAWCGVGVSNQYARGSDNSAPQCQSDAADCEQGR